MWSFKASSEGLYPDLRYARVSTNDQNPEAQRTRLIEAGATRVFTDIISGKRFDRPGLKARGIHLVSLEERPDTSSAAGELVFHVFGAIAHFERRLISERTRDGIAAARKTRPPTGSTAAGPGDGFGRAQTHRSRSVARSSGQTARYWQGNGLQTRRRYARRVLGALNVILGTNLPITPIGWGGDLAVCAMLVRRFSPR